MQWGIRRAKAARGSWDRKESLRADDSQWKLVGSLALLLVHLIL
jgi:hypothetical protein